MLFLELKELFFELKDVFILCFIDDNRWEWLVEGFVNSILITVLAIVIGLFFGIVLAAIRSSYDKNEESLKLRGGAGYILLKILNGVAKVYITVIRGIPVVVQLMIWYFVILVTQDNDIVVAVVAFGFNTAAYVAEIFRGGIISIDNGQFEAGRSLGFNYVQTMIYIVIPQTIKATLPTLLNEIIALLKETSVAGYVGIMDLTKAGDLIRGRTFEAFMPLIAVAIIYLITVVVLTKVFSVIERRLRKIER
ncbi:MAG: amino acid ABC transporter permease [Clostridia bacterium]|nr:amino acid ABC transporter permease [Clostridia bacterium]